MGFASQNMADQPRDHAARADFHEHAGSGRMHRLNLFTETNRLD